MHLFKPIGAASPSENFMMTAGTGPCNHARSGPSQMTVKNTVDTIAAGAAALA